jgi:hypothetical protein
MAKKRTAKRAVAKRAAKSSKKSKKKVVKRVARARPVGLISTATLPKGFEICGGGCPPPERTPNAIFCASSESCAAGCGCHLFRAAFGSTKWEHVAGPNQPVPYGDKERDFTYICLCGKWLTA